jgi:hypothetical protein
MRSDTLPKHALADASRTSPEGFRSAAASRRFHLASTGARRPTAAIASCAMRLTKARVTNFKSIDDSDWVDLDQVTCLVGKNESGKTAFLHALSRLKPVETQSADFDYELDYPRKDLNAYKRRHATDPAVVVTAVFELTDDELEAIEQDFGPGCLTETTFSVRKNYSNHTLFTIPYSEAAVVKHLVAEAGSSE